MQVFMLQRQYDGQWEDIQQWAEESLKGRWMFGSYHSIYLHHMDWVGDEEATMIIDKDEDAVMFALRWK